MAENFSNMGRYGRGEVRTFFCQIETYFGTKDYARHGRCVRLIGVNEHDFQSLIEGGKEGVTTHVIDLGFWRHFQRQLGLDHWWGVSRQLSSIEDLEEGLHRNRSWFCVEIEETEWSADYYYSTFSDDGPTYIDVIKFEPVSVNGAPLLTNGLGLRACASAFTKMAVGASHSPSVMAFPGTHAAQHGAKIGATFAPYSFHAFHVGQGMCSLIDNGQSGWLLDAGAGKPITRERYLDSYNPIGNDLSSKISPLSDLVMVASHTDYDHWKLLAWDKDLRTKVGTIFVPDGVDHLLFKDKAIIDKCVATLSMTIKLTHNTFLELIRAAPSKSDRNGDCIVAVFVRDAQRVLAPGDYVYSRFASDSSPLIQGLHLQPYKAVIVPHHGDKESANSVVYADTPDARAFFSAGTHGYYKHPTDASRAEHKASKFFELCDPTNANIQAILLL